MASSNTYLDTHKIDVPNSLLILIRRSCLSDMQLGKNEHQKSICSKEIELHAHNMLAI